MVWVYKNVQTAFKEFNFEMGSGTTCFQKLRFPPFPAKWLPSQKRGWLLNCLIFEIPHRQFVSELRFRYFGFGLHRKVSIFGFSHTNENQVHFSLHLIDCNAVLQSIKPTAPSSSTSTSAKRKKKKRILENLLAAARWRSLSVTNVSLNLNHSVVWKFTLTRFI